MDYLKTSYTDFIAYKIATSSPLDFIENDQIIDLFLSNRSFKIMATIKKETPANADQLDFETNYKSLANTKSPELDSETGGLKITNKFAPNGWLQRLHEVEFTTSTVGGAIHDKDKNNNDYGWSSIDFYEVLNGFETLMENPTQADLDTKCIRTDFKWMPNMNYMVLSGVISQFAIPPSNFYVWGLMLDAHPALGIEPIEVLGGGLNMRGVDERDRVGLKGVSGSTIYYNGVLAPSGFIETPPGMGTNRVRYICRHEVGLKHRLQSIFEIFRA